MADNTALNLGTGGDLIATDELTTLNGAAAAAGLKVQRVKLGFGTDNILRDVDAANPLPVLSPVLSASGSLTAAAQTVALTLGGRYANTTFQVTGTYVGTLAFEATNDGTNFTTINALRAGDNTISQTITDSASNDIYRCTTAGFNSVRIRANVLTSGSAVVTALATESTSGVFLNFPIPGITAVSVTANGVISTANSTSVALAANAVFTGPAEDITEFADVRLMVFADQPSAVDGLQLQQSTNGTNWDSIDAFTVPATTGRPFSVGASAKFYRVVYTNGATAQTAFRLQTKLYKAYGKGASVRPQDARSNENDFEEVLGFGMVYNGTSWDRARGDAINGLRTQMTAVTAATVLSVANTAATLTLPAPAAGQFHYVTRIRITLHNPTITAVAAAATTLSFTSTNLPGALAWTDGNALAAGTSKTVVDEQLENGIKSSAAATATTITAPLAGAGVVSRITAYFYTGP